MHMLNYFNFFPVGQGLFYFGSIHYGEFTFVYDCGTETKGVVLLDYIEEIAKICDRKKLDFLAISHFHWDHINGVEKLEQAIGFNSVYMPYISSDTNIRDFIIGMELFEDTQKLEPDRLIMLNYIRGLYNRDNRNRELGSGYISCKFNWVFKYFNRCLSASIEKKISSSINKLLKKYGAVDIVKLFEIGKLKELKKIYQDIIGKNKLNDTSLVLLHYPMFGSFFPRANFYPNYDSSNHANHLDRYFYPYTLLTGDIMLDDKMVSEILSSYPTGVSGFVQVPHHGSRFNWPPLINNFPLFDCYIVNYGTTNNYGHPDYLLKSHIPADRFFDNNEFRGFLYEII